MEGGEGTVCVLCWRDYVWIDFVFEGIGKGTWNKDTHLDYECVKWGQND